MLSLLRRRKMQRLGASKITQVDFLPKELVSYSKETQTPLTAHLSEGECVCVCLSVCVHIHVKLTLSLGFVGHQRLRDTTEPLACNDYYNFV